jgi:hypothetical protein
LKNIRFGYLTRININEIIMKRIVNEFKKNYYEKSITHLCDIRKEIINILDLYSHHLSNLDVIFFVDFLLNESEYPEKTEYKMQIMNKII